MTSQRTLSSKGEDRNVAHSWCWTWASLSFSWPGAPGVWLCTLASCPVPGIASHLGPAVSEKEGRGEAANYLMECEQECILGRCLASPQCPGN